MYRDLKPDNILITKEKYIKIADFGLSKYLVNDSSKSFVGTDEYIAPEVFQGEEHDYLVDWWSLGIITFELIIGKTPFFHMNKANLMQNVINL